MKREKENVLLRSIDKDTTLVWESFDEKQHFTQPPAHYTEASLVKTLEELGIGRPSTYAPTITTILARRYVVKENKKSLCDRVRRSSQRYDERSISKYCR